MLRNVANPSKQPPLKIKDSDANFRYVEFPEDTFYMESLAINNNYLPDVAFVPVQRYVNGREEAHIYMITPNSTNATHFVGPIATPDNNTKVSVWGSTLSSQGILYLCLWNRNSILVCDLKKVSDPGTSVFACEREIKHIPAPNDVALDYSDEDTLYVAGGRYMTSIFPRISNPPGGRIYRIKDVKSNGSTSQIVARGLDSLSGIESHAGYLHVAQLYDIRMYSEGTFKSSVIWKGNEKGSVWQSDNIDVFDSDRFLCPAYTTEPAWQTKVKKINPLYSIAFLFAQIYTSIVDEERLRDGLLDPTVSLSLSNTYIEKDVPPEPIRLILFNSEKKFAHFEIDLQQTRAENPPRDIFSRYGKLLGQRHFFNEQVTHAGHLGNTVAFVNFEQPRILLLDDTVFSETVLN